MKIYEHCRNFRAQSSNLLMCLYVNENSRQAFFSCYCCYYCCFRTSTSLTYVYCFTLHFILVQINPQQNNHFVWMAKLTITIATANNNDTKTTTENSICLCFVDAVLKYFRWNIWYSIYLRKNLK